VSAQPAKANRTSLLNYSYDQYAQPPAGAVPSAPTNLTISGQSVSRVTRAFAAQPVTLGSPRTSVRLAPPPTALVGEAQATGPLNLASGRRLYLVLGGLSAPADTTSTWNVFLGLPEGTADPGTSDPHYVGTLHFFGASGHAAHAPSSHRIAFNLTKRVRALTTAGALSASPSVTLVRQGDPESAAPTVAQVYLMEG
jgi:hypothetical protein